MTSIPPPAMVIAHAWLRAKLNSFIPGLGALSAGQLTAQAGIVPPDHRQ
jgi:hypothetical protein